MSRKRVSRQQEAIRIGSTWNSFSREHPEVEVVRNYKGLICDVHFPENVHNYFVIFNSEEILQLCFVSSRGELISYPS